MTMASLSDDMTHPEDLSDDELLDAIDEAYRDALEKEEQMKRLSAFNLFHDYRKEAADRGLREEASEITEAIREERAE